MRTFTVFNADQVQGAERFQVTEEPLRRGRQPDFEPAEELMTGHGADIRHGGDRAFYSLAGDFICLPHKERFVTPGTYYESCLSRIGPLVVNPGLIGTARRTATRWANWWPR